MIILIWPLVILFTLSLYGLILLTLPISATAATFFLFALIAFWSRLPGVGIPMPFWILYMADVIDLLSMIVAINIGGVYGAFLSLFANIGGRACGAFTPWGGNISDAIAMFIACLIIPSVYAVVGDLFTTMIIFQVIRIAIIVPLDLMGLYNPRGIIMYIVEWFICAGALFFINAVYIKLFGNFFDNLMKAGVAFSWPLFMFATVVIFGSYVVMYFFSDKESSYNLKGIKKRIKDLAEQSAKDEPKKESKPKKHRKQVKHHKPTEVKKEPKTILPVETIANGCPKCKSDVSGNNRQGFHCSSCNKTYRRRELQLMRF